MQSWPREWKKMWTRSVAHASELDSSTASAPCISYRITSDPATIVTLPPEIEAVVFFILGRGGGGVNFLMQLQFLAPVELFFKQLNGYSF